MQARNATGGHGTAAPADAADAARKSDSAKAKSGTAFASYHNRSLDPKRAAPYSISSSSDDASRKARRRAYPGSGDSDETQTSSASAGKHGKAVGIKAEPKKASGSSGKATASSASRGSDTKKVPQVKIKILNLDAWQLTYVRTRNNSLRCFPACRPVHRERSFCGLPVCVTVEARTENESKQMVVLGSFRKVKTDVIQIGDKFSTVELTRMLGSDFIIGTFLSFDKRAKQAKFKLGPPRKWRYVANTLSSTEMHTFTVYAFTQAGGKCIARQDSPFFTIVPAWRQSATEITARIQASSDNESRSEEGAKEAKAVPAAPAEPRKPPVQAEYAHPQQMPYGPRPPLHEYGAHRWEAPTNENSGGVRKRSRVPQSGEQDNTYNTHQQLYYGPGYPPHMGMHAAAMYNPYGPANRGMSDEAYSGWPPGMPMPYPGYGQQWPPANPYAQSHYSVQYDFNQSQQRPSQGESDSQGSESSSDASERSQKDKAGKKASNGKEAPVRPEGYYPMQQQPMHYPYPGYYHPALGPGQYPMPPQDPSAHSYPPREGYQNFQSKPS